MFYKKSRRVVVVVVVIPVLIVDFFISTCKVKSVHKEKTHPLQWLFELVGIHERSKKSDYMNKPNNNDGLEISSHLHQLQAISRM